MKIKICICGGGSLGHVCAGVLASQGATVNLFTQHPDMWSQTIAVTDNEGKLYQGKLNSISSRADEVVPGADIVLLCLPGYMMERTLMAIKSCLTPGSIVASIVSSTGFFFQAHQLLDAQTPLLGFQRTPYIARVANYGKTAHLLGYKKSCKIAVEHVADKEKVRQTIEACFHTPTILLNNYYEASLTNSNPILHTGRLYVMWKDWNGEPYMQCPSFYKEWDDESSAMILDMDAEFMNLLDKLRVGHGHVPSLLEYYESDSVSALTRKLASIQAFQHIPAPMIQTEKGWLPDYGSRYFTEDFPYGLRYIKELAATHGVDTPVIDQVYSWGMNKLETISKTK